MSASHEPDPAASPAALSPAAEARRLLRAAATATLATVGRGTGGWPFASLVLVAVDHDATPILLLSDLAEHSRNIVDDERVSLLVAAADETADPLTRPRLSLVARAATTAEPRHRARFLARHPEAGSYVDFSDFRFYRLAVENARFVAGFGRIHSLTAAGLRADAPAALTAAEADILAHMNEDHADTVALYARVLCDSGDDDGSARFVGIDAEGCDIRAGDRLLRLDFERPVNDAQEARAALVALDHRARGMAPD